MGCADNLPEEGVVEKERINENAKIVTYQGTYHDAEYERKDILYEKGGNEFSGYFDPDLRGALDWVDENIDGKFLCWWDYGHMIRGYTGNEVVIFSPSEDILWSLSSGRWDEEKSGAFSSKEKVADVAAALTAESPQVTRQTMQKYNASHVFVTTRDAASAFVLFRIAGLEEYLEGDYSTNEKAASSMIYRMVNMERIDGFEFVYSDSLVRIYQASAGGLS